MPRLFTLAPVLVFLVAVASNSLQASPITLGSISSPVAVIDASNPSNKTVPTEFLLGEDDSDESPHLAVVQSSISVIEPALSPFQPLTERLFTPSNLQFSNFERLTLSGLIALWVSPILHLVTN